MLNIKNYEEDRSYEEKYIHGARSPKAKELPGPYNGPRLFWIAVHFNGRTQVNAFSEKKSECTAYNRHNFHRSNGKTANNTD